MIPFAQIGVIRGLVAEDSMSERFENWRAPVIEHNKPTVYNWVVQYPDGLKLGHHTDNNR